MDNYAAIAIVAGSGVYINSKQNVEKKQFAAEYVALNNSSNNTTQQNKTDKKNTFGNSKSSDDINFEKELVAENSISKKEAITTFSNKLTYKTKQQDKTTSALKFTHQDFDDQAKNVKGFAKIKSSETTTKYTNTNSNHANNTEAQKQSIDLEKTNASLNSRTNDVFNSSQLFTTKSKDKYIEQNNVVVSKTDSTTNSSNTSSVIKKSNLVDSNQIKSSVAKTKQPSSTLHYGLQFTAPVFFGANSYNTNAQQQPLSLIIPAVYVSKTFKSKHTIQLSFNPYAQYFVNNKTIASHEVYSVTTQNGNNVMNGTTAAKYEQTIAYNKLISVEAGINYSYHIKPRLQIGIGFYSNWATGAVVQNTVVKNKTQVLKSDFIGLEKISIE